MFQSGVVVTLLLWSMMSGHCEAANVTNGKKLEIINVVNVNHVALMFKMLRKKGQLFFYRI